MRRGRSWGSVLGLVAVVAGGFVGVPATADADGNAPREVSYRRLPTTDVEVFMKVGASGDQIAGVRATLRNAGGTVDTFSFLDQQDAYAEFQRIFHRQPKLVAKTLPTDLPVSFRVRLRKPVAATVPALRAALAGAPGVDSIQAKSKAAQEQEVDAPR